MEFILTDEEIEKLKQASSICCTATADFIANCDINSLNDPEVKKLMKQIDRAANLLHSIDIRYFIEHELAHAS